MKIPTDLVPGDRLWYSKTEYATVDNWGGGDTPCSHQNATILARCNDGIMAYCIHTGKERWGDTPPIIRIERIASAKPKRKKVDRDAAWLLSLLHEGRHKFTDHAAKRLRAIARRLSKGEA